MYYVIVILPSTQQGRACIAGSCDVDENPTCQAMSYKAQTRNRDWSHQKWAYKRSDLVYHRTTLMPAWREVFAANMAVRVGTLPTSRTRHSAGMHSAGMRKAGMNFGVCSYRGHAINPQISAQVQDSKARSSTLVPREHMLACISMKHHT